MILHIKLKNLKEQTFSSVDELTFRFKKNIGMVEYHDISGPIHYEFELSELESHYFEPYSAIEGESFRNKS